MLTDDCTRCPLHVHALTVCVPGRGPTPTEIMLVGEAPGAAEDMEGEPFVGTAGRELDTLLREAGIDPAAVRISTAVRCRPPKSRDPMEAEIDACREHLKAEIALVQPQAIIALGGIALHALTWANGITRFRGKVMPLDEWFGHEATVWPTFHPAAALYQPSNRAKIVADLTNARDHDRVQHVKELRAVGCRFHVGKAGDTCQRCNGTWEQHFGIVPDWAKKKAKASQAPRQALH